MTVTRMETPQPEEGWASQDEDVGNGYIAVLMRWSREIVAITVAAAMLAGLAAFAVNRLGEPRYKAWADVAIVRTVSQLNFDQRFTTTSDEAMRIDGDLIIARRNALIGLAESPAIAAQVIEPLGDVLGAKERVPANLARMIKATLVSGTGRPGESDLIRITATANTPAKAAQIATTWAQTYVRKVNQIYGQAPDELLASVNAEQVQAKANYEQAQAALERFAAENRLDELTRQITETQDTIDQIVKARVDLRAAYFSAEAQSRILPFERWLQVTDALDEARTLRYQVAAGGAGSTGSGAVVAGLLKLQALTQVLERPKSTGQSTGGSTEGPTGGSTGGSTGQLQLQIQLDANSTLSSAELLADIDALVQALEQRRSELERQIAAPDEQWLNADKYAHLGQTARGATASAGSVQAQQASLLGQDEKRPDVVSASVVSTATVGSDLLDSTVRSLEQEVRGLRAQIEAEYARQLQLTQQRDLAWETFKTVNSKVAELALARAAASSEVRFAAPSVPPARPTVAMGTLKAAALGGILGLLIGVFVALVATSFGIPPFFSRRRAKA